MEHPIHVGVLKRVLAQDSSAELTEKYADTVRNTQVGKRLTVWTVIFAFAM